MPKTYIGITYKSKKNLKFKFIRTVFVVSTGTYNYAL